MHLFNETEGSVPITEEDVSQIISLIKQHEACSFNLIEIAFVGEDKMLEVNREYLNHDYLTDIITFHYSDKEDITNIEGTLYCCFPQIKQQAEERSQSLKNEFLRIVIHGLLHLCGYEDKTRSEKTAMTRKENFYLSKLSLS